MKTKLLITILLLTSITMQAQKVLIKDSVLLSTNDGPYMPANGDNGVTVFTLNHFCKDSIAQSSTDRSFYFYDSLQRLTETDAQYVYPGTDTFRNSGRTRQSYTSSGKIDTLTYGSTNSTSNAYFDYSQIVFTYDAQDYVVKQSFYRRNGTTDPFTYTQGILLFNNAAGKPDSTYTLNATSTDTSVSYYTYYPSGLEYQRMTYHYVNGNKQLLQTLTSYHDSANYIKRDSIVTVGKQLFSDTVTITNINSTTIFFNSDGTAQEKDIYLYFNNASPATNLRYKFFYTYADCPQATLPVSFLSFSAEKQNHNAVLKWQTGSESNTASFVVQRSEDGIHFTTVGSVSVRGNGSHQYTFTDANALQAAAEPKLYYRLEEKEKDGSVLYSTIATLDIAAGKVFITASPNPATNEIKVYSSVALNDAVITISDLRGRQLYSAKQNIPAGSSVPIDVSAFAKGMYIVTVQSSSYKQQVKIVKE